MSPVRIRYQTIEIGDLDIHLRTLRDRQQFEDDDRVAEGLGISSAAWPLFGVVWESGLVLARLMADFDVAGRRVLEVGCGIAVASQVLNQRHADITATDRHPEAGAFLRANTDLNGEAEIPFVRTGWDDTRSSLRRFDLIIGSDLLYERGHAESLAAFIDQHAKPVCEVVIVDPGRSSRGRFSREMASLGYAHSRRAVDPAESGGVTFGGEILTYNR